MKINVEIIDEVTQYEFESNSITIGSGDSCDLCLNYEEIGQEHIRIFKDLGKYFLEELNSGEETLLNDIIIAPGSSRELTSLFPVEIGGLLIHLVEDDEVDEEQLSNPASTREKQKKISKSKKETRKKRKSLDPSVIIYFILLVLVGGSVWNFYSKRNKIKVTEVSTDNTNTKKTIEVELDLNSRLKPYKSEYTSTMAMLDCDQKCVEKYKLPKNLKNIKVFLSGERLFVGIDSKVLNQEEASFYKRLSEDDIQLKKIIESQYNAYFTYDEFTQNKMVSPFKPLITSYSVYKKVIQLYMFFLSHQLETNFSDFKNIHLFMYEKDTNYIKVFDFVQVERESLKYLNNMKESDAKDLILFSKYKLTDGIESFFRSRFESSQDSFSPRNRDEYNEQQFQVGITNAIKNLNCNKTQDLCKKLRVSGEYQQNEGVNIHQDLLMAAWDIDYKTTEFINEYKEYKYSKLELKMANQEYSKASGEKSFKYFRDNSFFYRILGQNYFSKHPKHFFKSRLILDFLESDILPHAFKNPNITRLLIIGKKSSDIEFGCFLELKDLSIRDRKRVSLYKKLIWRSYLPVMDEFIKERCSVFKGF